MHTPQQTGKNGESLAEAYFLQKNYTILHRNWRSGSWEIDLIASNNSILHFIEVKTRSSMVFGYAEENVSQKKIQNLIDAAEMYLIEFPQWERIQFDILSIHLDNGRNAEYFLIEDVFV